VRKKKMSNKKSTNTAKLGKHSDILTKRELEVLALLPLAKTNREIAHELVIVEATVERHLHSIFRKMGFKSRVEAAVYALVHNIGN
jgi:two-component system, NarL family, nitrate/nitrite response regulator NarL